MKSKSTLNSIMKHSNAEYTNKLFVTFDLQSFFLWQKQKNKNKKMKALFYSVVLKDHLYLSSLRTFIYHIFYYLLLLDKNNCLIDWNYYSWHSFIYRACFKDAVIVLVLKWKAACQDRSEKQEPQLLKSLFRWGAVCFRLGQIHTCSLTRQGDL